MIHSGTAVLTAIAITLSAVVAAPALAADEAGVVKARLDLDKAERLTAKLPKGDIPAAKKAMALVSQAKKALLGCEDRKAEAWITQAKRARDLDAKIRELAGVPAAAKAVKADASALLAKKLLDEVARGLPKLPAGDVPAGNKLIAKVNRAVSELKKSKARGSKEWQESAKRYSVLDKAIRKRLAEKPAAPVPSPKKPDPKTPEPKKPVAGKPVAGKPVAGKPAKPGAVGPEPADEPRMGTDQAYKYRRDFRDQFGRYEKELAAARPIDVIARRKIGYFESTPQRFRAVLKKLSPQSHPRIQWAYRRVAAYEKLLAVKIAEGRKQAAAAKAAASKEAADVDTELKAIEEFFDPKTFRCDLAPPYDEQKVRAWVAEIKEYQSLKTKGIAQLDRFVKERPKYAGSPRVKKLRFFFERRLGEKINAGMNRTLNMYAVSSSSRSPGYMLAMIQAGENLLAYTKGGIKESNLADDGWVRKSLETLQEAILGAQMKNVFNDAYFGRKDFKLTKLTKDFMALRQKLEASAARVLAETRMPKSAPSSASLRALAIKTLKNPKYGVKPYRRLVVNSPKKSFTEPKSASRVEGDYLKIWKWTEKWEEFQVCAAEERDGGLRLVFYTIKYISVGPSWKKGVLNRWFVSEQIVSRRILAENVDK